jgi:lipid-binding SYLF domain-containing protein
MSMKHTATTAALLVFLAGGVFAAPVSDKGQSEETERVTTAAQVIRDIVDLPEEGIPEALLKKAYGIAIIPGVIQAAYGVGGQYGKGVLLVRGEGGDWSPPCFISIFGGSIGWQIGVQKSDILLVFKSAKSVDGIARGKITMGADASVAAGPQGRRAEASTDLELEAEIYSYSRSKGLFAGIAIKGASIQIDKKANRRFYDDRGLSARDILDGRVSDLPEEAEALRRTVAVSTEKDARRI